jgi:hypothetical protein
MFAKVLWDRILVYCIDVQLSTCLLFGSSAARDALGKVAPEYGPSKMRDLR